MELAKLFVDLVLGLVWPVTLLIIFIKSKEPLSKLVDHLKGVSHGPRDIRAKMGSFELSLETKQQLVAQAEMVKEEGDPIKRLRKAKDISKKETIINDLSEDEVKDLINYHMEMLPHTFLPDWWHLPDDYKNRLNELSKKGLVSSYGIYGDEMMYFTPLGVEVLKALGIEKQERHNKEN